MKVLITGGSGRLGSALVPLLGGEVVAPRSRDMDITNVGQLERVLRENAPDVVVNCAAFTDVARAENEPAAAFELNVQGTYNVFRACEALGARMVQLSTDHIFDGSRGMYREDDRPRPVGAYAVSKYLGEQVVLLEERNTVLRTSFIKEFPLPAAFDDKFFSGDVVSVIAAELALAINSGITGLWHVAGPRVSIYEVARKINPAVERMKLADNPVNKVGLAYLKDVSLDTTRWQRFKASALAAGGTGGIGT